MNTVNFLINLANNLPTAEVISKDSDQVDVINAIEANDGGKIKKLISDKSDYADMTTVTLY